MDLDVIDGNYKTATIFHLDGNDFTLLHDAMARLLEGLLQFGRNGVGNCGPAGPDPRRRGAGPPRGWSRAGRPPTWAG